MIVTNIFFIAQPYQSLHNYDHLSIPFLANFFTNADDIQKYLHMTAISVLYICNYLSILCLAAIFVFENGVKCSTTFKNILHFAIIFVPSHLHSLMYSSFGKHVSFFSFMPISFQILH